MPIKTDLHTLRETKKTLGREFPAMMKLVGYATVTIKWLLIIGIVITVIGFLVDFFFLEKFFR